VVIGGDGVLQDVEWGVLGNNLPGTHIDDSGQLTVDAGETSPALVVTARSKADEAVSGAALALVSYVTGVTASPGTATVERGGERQFTAVVEGRNIPPDMAGVTWSVSGGKNNTETAVTTVSENGLLTVAANETGTDGALTVRATSLYDPAAYAEIKPVIAQVSVVTVSSESPVSVTKGGTRQFSATVSGDGLSDANRAVTWSVSGAANTGATVISESGLLTVAADESAASLTVTASSVYDTGKSASVSVTVNGFSVTFYGDGSTPLLTPPAITNVNYGMAATLPALPVKEGSVAKGWYTAASGGAKLSGTTLPITADTKVYVQWLGSTDTKRPNAGGGDQIKYVSTGTGFDEVHLFTTSGPFIALSPITNAQILVVAGGGGGGRSGEANQWRAGGGGGGGGVTHNSDSLGAATYNVTVGAGGAASANVAGQGNTGGDSSFGPKSGAATFVAKGGGGGAGHAAGTASSGTTGGSSGGSSGSSSITSVSSQTVPQGGSVYGNKGGNGTSYSAGGGGGATGAGASVTATYSGGAGGAGLSSTISGTTVIYGGGGDAGSGTAGPVNTGKGGGGGGGPTTALGGAGGSGIVVISFPYQYTGD
jgi:hypothetical protein